MSVQESTAPTHIEYGVATTLKRYSRQILIPQIGMNGQASLQKRSVAIVGAGGIGSTVLMYMAAAGVGTIHIIDDDFVDESNLHRQIIHSTSSINVSKADSAKERLLSINPHINVIVSKVRLVATNAIELLRDVEVVIDATDNQPARYVLNDACVLLQTPLVSGSAVGLEGQITVVIPYETPCYRCLYPTPSAVDNCRSCDNTGVLGPIPGLIGCLEAVEAIKLLTQMMSPESKKYASYGFKSLTNRQVLYDGLTSDFHTFDLPERNRQCLSCGDEGIIVSKEISKGEGEEAFTLLQQNPLQPSQRISCVEYVSEVISTKTPHILLDVRSEIQFDMINLKSYYMQSNHKPQDTEMSPDSADQFNHLIDFSYNEINQRHIPLKSILESNAVSSIPATDPVFVVCRRGIDSVIATEFLSKSGFTNIRNIDGGLVSWRKYVDSEFPSY